MATYEEAYGGAALNYVFQCTFSSLKPETSYTFRLSGQNRVGFGECVARGMDIIPVEL